MQVITKSYNVYSFDELSEEAKENVKNNLGDYWGEWIFSDACNTLEKFCDLFDIDYRNIDFLESYRNHYFINLESTILELSGLRLRTYIINNYHDKLFKGKYYSKSKYLDGKFINKFRYSKIIKENSCVLTGVCYDDDVLKPIYEFLENPKSHIDFETLLDDCIYSLCHSVSMEYESIFEDDYLSEHFKVNGCPFTEDGELF